MTTLCHTLPDLPCVYEPVPEAGGRRACRRCHTWEPTPAELEERSLVSELMAMDDDNQWLHPYLVGTVAHYYRDCQDMKQTAKVMPALDPYRPRPGGPTPCRYCLERWDAS